jgi:hypothetical protein
MPQLFGLAKVAFASMPGWSDERVLEVLEHDVIFVAREKGQPAGYVALRRDEGGVIALVGAPLDREDCRAFAVAAPALAAEALARRSSEGASWRKREAMSEQIHSSAMRSSATR